MGVDHEELARRRADYVSARRNGLSQVHAARRAHIGRTTAWAIDKAEGFTNPRRPVRPGPPVPRPVPGESPRSASESGGAPEGRSLSEYRHEDLRYGHDAAREVEEAMGLRDEASEPYESPTAHRTRLEQELKGLDSIGQAPPKDLGQRDDVGDLGQFLARQKSRGGSWREVQAGEIAGRGARVRRHMDSLDAALRSA